MRLSSSIIEAVQWPVSSQEKGSGRKHLCAVQTFFLLIKLSTEVKHYL